MPKELRGNRRDLRRHLGQSRGDGLAFQREQRAPGHDMRNPKRVAEGVFPQI
jgi:hypothetical protein